MDLTFIKYVTIRGMWMLNGCLYDYFPRDGIVLTQEQKSAITAATTAYKATSELFPDNNFGEFEFMYVFAFLESRYGETIGYDVTEDVIRAEFQLLGEYYTEIKNIGNLKEVTLTFEDLKARCFEVNPQFE